MSARYRIEFYAENEADVFQPWPHATHSSHIEQWQLDIARKHASAGQMQVQINGLRVHALVFRSGERWDTVNGMNQVVKNFYETLTQAHEQNLHMDGCSVCGKYGAELWAEDFQCWYAICPHKNRHKKCGWVCA